jgi:hypothetical protein
MKTGPYSLCHTDRGSIQWWAWPAVSLGLGLFAAAPAIHASAGGLAFMACGVVMGVFLAPSVGVVAVAVDMMRWNE